MPTPLKFHINHPSVIEMANKEKITISEAIAILTAEDFGIKKHEMVHYIFQFNHLMRTGYMLEESIEKSLHSVIMKPIQINASNRKVSATEFIEKLSQYSSPN